MSFTKTILAGLRYWIESKFIVAKNETEDKFATIEKELEGKQPVGNYALSEDLHQPDWAASADENGYVLNRTHWTSNDEYSLCLPPTLIKLEFEETDDVFRGFVNYGGIISTTNFKVVWQDEVWEGEACNMGSSAYPRLSLEPYFPSYGNMIIEFGRGTFQFEGYHEGQGVVAIYEKGHDVYHPLKEEYIPDTIARTAEIKAVKEAVDNITWGNIGEKEEYDIKFDGYIGDLTTIGDSRDFSSKAGLLRGEYYSIILVDGDDREEVLTKRCERGSGDVWGYLEAEDLRIEYLYGSDFNGFRVTRVAEYRDGIQFIKLALKTTAVYPIDEKYIPDSIAKSASSHGLTVADASGENVTAAEFNTLLTALRNAGYLAASE